MKAELNINGKIVNFEGTLEDLSILLMEPKTSWSYKYIHGSDGWLNIVSAYSTNAIKQKFYVGWALSPRQFDGDWEWLNDHSYAVYDFDSLLKAIEYAEKY